MKVAYSPDVGLGKSNLAMLEKIVFSIKEAQPSKPYNLPSLCPLIMHRGLGLGEPKGRTFYAVLYAIGRQNKEKKL